MVNSAVHPAFARMIRPAPSSGILKRLIMRQVLKSGRGFSVADLTFRPALPRILRRNANPKAS